MKVLYNWLKDFADLAATPEELGARRAMCGVPVESLGQSRIGIDDLQLFFQNDVRFLRQFR